MTTALIANAPRAWAPFEAETINLGREAHDESEPQKFEWSYAGQHENDLIELAALLEITIDKELTDLVLRQGHKNKRGFCSGHARGNRIVVTVCPNADVAEAMATLVHEATHVAGERQHNEAFNRRMLDIAGDVWGTGWFDMVDPRQPTWKVDSWLATCIRAAEYDREIPTSKAGDPERQGAVIRRVIKLRRIADKHPGTPEAISATSLANDLVVLWDLGVVKADISDGVEDALCDQYVVVGKRKKWLRNLMWAVCGFFDVYAIAQASMGTMHLFGRHTAIQSAMHLFEVAKAHIERRLTEHLERWESAGRPNGKHKRRESTDFKYSAARALRLKLERKDDPGAVPQGSTALAHYDKKAAKQFMHDTHERLFGSKVRLRTEPGARYAHNAAGAAAGRSVPMGAGVTNQSGALRLTR